MSRESSATWILWLWVFHRLHQVSVRIVVISSINSGRIRFLTYTTWLFFGLLRSASKIIQIKCPQLKMPRVVFVSSIKYNLYTACCAFYILLLLSEISFPHHLCLSDQLLFATQDQSKMWLSPV